MNSNYECMPVVGTEAADVPSRDTMTPNNVKIIQILNTSDKMAGWELGCIGYVRVEG